jgi:hypothetical protein
VEGDGKTRAAPPCRDNNGKGTYKTFSFITLLCVLSSRASPSTQPALPCQGLGTGMGLLLCVAVCCYWHCYCWR